MKKRRKINIVILIGFFCIALLFLGTAYSILKQDFKRGDICIIQKITNYKQILNIQEGDIIEYQLNNIFVLHRVNKIIQTDTGFYYYTKGDSNETQDILPVKEEQIVGKVLYIVPYLGYPSVWFSEWLSEKSR